MKIKIQSFFLNIIDMCNVYLHEKENQSSVWLPPSPTHSQDEKYTFSPQEQKQNQSGKLLYYTLLKL